MSTEMDRARPMLVRSMALEADGVLSVVLEPEDDVPLPTWEPGAHVDVLVPDGSARQYSLCNAAVNAARLRIAVRHDAEGRGGSDWVHRRLRPGDVVQVRGPRNHFPLEQAPGYLFIAGGIGITPLLPMVREVAARGTEWQLLYFGRSRRAMAFLAELPPHGDRVHLLTDDERRGTELTSALDALPPEHLVYSCGPAGLTAAVRAALESRGHADRLRTEHFSAPAVEQPAPSGAFTVRLDRSGVEIEVPADRSVLSAVTAAGVDVLSDCEEGICGSCETRVLEGLVDHRDWVLTDQEKRDGGCMMLCVSRALSDRLVLDL